MEFLAKLKLLYDRKYGRKSPKRSRPSDGSIFLAITNSFLLKRARITLSISIESSYEVGFHSIRCFFAKLKLPYHRKYGANESSFTENSDDTISFANTPYFLLQSGGWLDLYPLRTSVKRGSILWNGFCKNYRLLTTQNNTEWVPIH